MDQTQAEQMVAQLIKPIFGFTKTRCTTMEDAEDVTQEICLKLYRALLARDDIAEPDAFAWTIAHNTLANYYRNRSRNGNNIPIHGLTDVLPFDRDITIRVEEAETAERLYREIAYLSKTRRRIVILYYFEGKRQQEIADALNLSLGTVKWYLSEAKSELQKGMVNMRNTSELKFNPVQFNGISTNGSAGYLGGNGAYLRSALTQNILYLTRRKAMTVNDMADQLGVSPVYIESEAEYLEQNGFMKKSGKGYIANVLINNPTTESNRLMSKMYDSAAEVFAPELFDVLSSDIKLGEDGVIGPDNDLNFALWALIPYVTARSGKPGSVVTFEEAATIRPDGGINICSCSVANPDAEPIKYHESFSKMGGPTWNGNDKLLLWFIDTVWGGNRVENYHPDLLNHDMNSLKAFFDGTLSEDDAVRMAERGYLSRKHNPSDGKIRNTLQIVWLNREAEKRLINLTDTIRDNHETTFDALKATYIVSQLKDTPDHMKRAQAYTLQHIFHSDGCFILFVINKLIEKGRLTLPTEDQRNSLGAIVVY